MIHSFFTEINAKPDLLPFVNTTITTLPAAHTPAGTVKAILLGADPTNDGIPKNRGLKILDKVLGIDGQFESYFFGIQQRNLKAIGLSKNNVYIQNVCRNYFSIQTSENKYWYKTAALWTQHIKKDLESYDRNIPILATCKEVYTFLTGKSGPFSDIYNLKIELPSVCSIVFKREVLPLFRGRAYILNDGKWTKYKNYLTEYFK